jgi:hypothetical protein
VVFLQSAHLIGALAFGDRELQFMLDNSPSLQTLGTFFFFFFFFVFFFPVEIFVFSHWQKWCVAIRLQRLVSGSFSSEIQVSLSQALIVFGDMFVL